MNEVESSEFILEWLPKRKEELAYLDLKIVSQKIKHIIDFSDFKIYYDGVEILEIDTLDNIVFLSTLDTVKIADIDQEFINIFELSKIDTVELYIFSFVALFKKLMNTIGTNKQKITLFVDEEEVLTSSTLEDYLLAETFFENVSNFEFYIL